MNKMIKDNIDELFTYSPDSLRKTTERVNKEFSDRYFQSITQCFKDVIKDLANRVETAALKGKYFVTSNVNICISHYLKEEDINDLTVGMRDDWQWNIIKQLDEYFGKKGFNTNLKQDNYYTLDWSNKEEYHNPDYDPVKLKEKEPDSLIKIGSDEHHISDSDFTASIKDYNFPTINGDFNPESQGLYSDVKCPYCGAKHFMEKYSISDSVYRPTIYKDGKVISPIKDEGITTTFECLDCGKEFKI